MPWRVHRPRPRRGVLLRARGRQDRPARARPEPATHTTLSPQNHPALAEIGHHLGVAIGSLVNIFGPERVVIGGGFGVAAFELLLIRGAARRRCARRSLPGPGEEPESCAPARVRRRA